MLEDGEDEDDDHGSSPERVIDLLAADGDEALDARVSTQHRVDVAVARRVQLCYYKATRELDKASGEESTFEEVRRAYRTRSSCAPASRGRTRFHSSIIIPFACMD